MNYKDINELDRFIDGRLKIDKKLINATNRKIRQYFDHKLFPLGFKRGEKYGTDVIVAYGRTIYDVEQYLYILVGTVWGITHRSFCDITINQTTHEGDKTDDVEFETIEELEAVIPYFEKFIDEKLLSLDEDFYKTQITRKLNKDVYDNYKEVAEQYLKDNCITLNNVEDVRKIANDLLDQYKGDNNNFYKYVLIVASIYTYYLSLKYPEYELKYLDDSYGFLMAARPDYRDHADVVYWALPTRVAKGFWMYGDGNHLSLGDTEYYYCKKSNKIMKSERLKEIIK